MGGFVGGELVLEVEDLAQLEEVFHLEDQLATAHEKQWNE